jgi:hypothetical protein
VLKLNKKIEYAMPALLELGRCAGSKILTVSSIVVNTAMRKALSGKILQDLNQAAVVEEFTVAIDTIITSIRPPQAIPFGTSASGLTLMQQNTLSMANSLTTVSNAMNSPDVCNCFGQEAGWQVYSRGCKLWEGASKMGIGMSTALSRCFFGNNYRFVLPMTAFPAILRTEYSTAKMDNTCFLRYNGSA